MIVFKRNTLVIVVSDIHIGNESCRIQELAEFLDSILQNIINRKLPFLRALIILGDFFDLLATSFEDLCSNEQYFQIYNELDQIKKQKIEVILALGNHEISTSLFYNLQFTGRKKNFLRKFDYYSFPFDFLTLKTMCQYVILVNSDDYIYLCLMDSIHDEPFVRLHLAKGSFLNNETYFMCHGYQFEDKDTHHSVTGWWDYARNLTEGWKKIITFIWSDINSSLQKRDNSRFYDNIITSLENTDKAFSHIIFGHTHKCEIKDSKILNTGCWLKDSNPSYLEISIDGSCKLYEINYI